MRFWLRRVRVTFLRRTEAKTAAAAILAGLLSFASFDARADGSACDIVPPDAQTLIDCCCTNDGCSTEACQTNTCSNETCSRDSCTTDTCSNDRCSSDSCTSDTCKTERCKSETCSSDSCKNDSCSSDNCKTDTCSVDTCRASNCGYDTCKSDTCSTENCKTESCDTNRCSSDSCSSDTCGSETCSRDTCTSDNCSSETCSRDSCSRDTCSTATCAADSCDTQTCGTDGCNFVKENDTVIRDFRGTDGGTCGIGEFGSPAPATGLGHLNLLDSQRRPIANNRVELTAGRSTGVSYKMIYRADATRNQEFRWRLAGRSSQALEITGTTGVGPIRGIIDDRNPATLSLRAPRSLAGQRHWLRFEVTVDGRVAHEKYLFIDVR